MESDSWRLAGPQPDRPMFYDFNAIFVPKLAGRTYLELMAGIGSQATRFYQPFQICDFNTCKNCDHQPLHGTLRRRAQNFRSRISLYGPRLTTW
jgi:hypothetical protein